MLDYYFCLGTKSSYYQQPIICCTRSRAFWGATAFQQWGPSATAAVKFVPGLLSENSKPPSLWGFAKAWRNQDGYWNESIDISSLLAPAKKTQSTKSLRSAPLTGSLRKHKVSVKFYFLQWQALTRVCYVSLVCDVWFKNVLWLCEPPPVSHNREPSAQAEGRNTVSVLWKQSEQKKTSWKYHLLSAAGCCHEWPKQICLAPLSGWEQTTLQPDRSIKNCCFPEQGKDVADIDVSWYPQPELKAWDVPAS